MAKVSGTDGILKALASFGKKGAAMTAAVVQSTAMDVNREAKTNAPKNYGKLAQSIINNVSESGLRVAIEVGVAYGAFVEFGTGIYVDVPAELQQEALKFKGKGSGGGSGDFEDSDFFQAILDWVKRRGITGTYSIKTRKRTGNKEKNEDEDKRVAFVIAMSILKKGIKPQPYLYPAFVKHRALLKPKLAKAMDRLIKETNAA